VTAEIVLPSGFHRKARTWVSFHRKVT